MINKKCLDATHMIRYFETRISNNLLPKNFFELFPNIETVETYGNDSLKSIANSDVAQRIKQIKAKGVYSWEFPYVLSNKIVSLSLYWGFSTDLFDFKQFPNLKRITVNCHEGKSLLVVHESLKAMNLEKVIIITRCANYDILKTFSDFKNKIIKIQKSYFSNDIAKQVIDKLKPIGNVYIDWLDEGVNMNNCFVPFDNINLNEKCDVNDIYKNCAFFKCCTTGRCDLRKCEFLEIVDCAFSTKSSVLVEGLTNLKSISDVHPIDVIPSSVTQLSLNSEFNFKDFIQQQKTRFGDGYNCFKNIKKLNLKIKQNEYIPPKVSGMFIECEYMGIANESFKRWFDLPTSLTKLHISFNYNKKQIIEVGKLKKLRSLLLSSQDVNEKFIKFIDYDLVHEAINNLPELEYLYTNLYDDSITIPSTVTNLDLILYRSVNLNKYTTLKSIELGQSSRKQEIKVVLPTKIDSLKIGKKIFVENSYEIEINTLALPRVYENGVPTINWNARSIEYKN